MSRAFSFTPFDDTQTSTASSSSSADAQASSDPLFRSIYTPLSPTNASTASVSLAPDAPVYRGMTLDYQHLTDEPSFAWHETSSHAAKQLSLPSLSSFDSSADTSSSSSAFSHKLSSLPELQVVDAASTRPLSPLPAQFDRQFTFLSSSSSTALLSFLMSAFASSSLPFSAVASLHPRYPSISLSVHQNNRSGMVAINLFSSSTASSSSSPVVVEFQRRSGDFVLFQSLFTSTVELLQSAGHFMSPYSNSFSLAPLSPLSPPSFSRASTDMSSMSSAPPSMDDSDDELDLFAMSVYKEQALHAENHHIKRDALYALYQSNSSPLTAEADVDLVLASACSAADVQERELSMELLSDKVLPSLPLQSAVFARCAAQLLSALSASSPSVWWHRAASQALLICSHAEGVKLDKSVVQKLASNCQDEPSTKLLEQVLDASQQ